MRVSWVLLVLASVLWGGLFQVGCEPSSPSEGGSDASVAEKGPAKEGSGGCQAEPQVMKTSAGIQFVRTPDACFKDLPGFPYEAKYVEIDGLRQAYYEDGPSSGEVILLLHGQPSWSYLYRKMIPVLAKAGYRVIAMDHLGMGRSDKPIQIAQYSYLGHIRRLEKFIEALKLEDITLFCQDWGSLIGLHVAGTHPDWFARIAVGDGTLPVLPAGVKPHPDVENPDQVDPDLKSPFAGAPAQQMPFYDSNCKLKTSESGDFGQWMKYSMKGGSFRPSEVLEALTWFDLPAKEEAAYDAPFPRRIYMAGVRTFPSLINQLHGKNQQAWEGLKSYAKPFLTLWAANDPGNLGQCSTQDNLICSIPGAKDQPHARLAKASHFLQDDQGAELARRIVDFLSKSPSIKGNYTASCGSTPAKDGTGTPCTSDDSCSALKTAKKCIKLPTSPSGFCSVEGCQAGSCADGYLCCRDCNPAVASLLPFKNSACFPSGVTSQLTGTAGCTCD